MPGIVSFIGWHNSGKTTLATQVVSILSRRGYKVGVIKSSRSMGATFDTPGTDTFKHREAGAENVLFTAPDQTVFLSRPMDASLNSLAARFLPGMDIVIAEGFKTDPLVPKIEVVRDRSRLMGHSVANVVAVAADREVDGFLTFKLDDSVKITDFIEANYCTGKTMNLGPITLTVNGTEVPVRSPEHSEFIRLVTTAISALKLPDEPQQVEIHVSTRQD